MEDVGSYYSLPFGAAWVCAVAFGHAVAASTRVVAESGRAFVALEHVVVALAHAFVAVARAAVSEPAAILPRQIFS